MSADETNPSKSEKKQHAIFVVRDAQGGAVPVSFEGIATIRIKGWFTFLSRTQKKSTLSLFFNGRCIPTDLWDQVNSFPIAGKIELFSDEELPDREIGKVIKERAVPSLALLGIVQLCGKLPQSAVCEKLIASLRELPDFKGISDQLELSNVEKPPPSAPSELSASLIEFIRCHVQKFSDAIDHDVIYCVEYRLLDSDSLSSELTAHSPSPKWQEKRVPPATTFIESVASETILDFFRTLPEIGERNIGLVLKSVPSFGYSLAWAKMPFVREIYVANQGKTRLPAFELRLDLRSFATQYVSIPSLAPGQQYGACPMTASVTRKQLSNLAYVSSAEPVTVEVSVNGKLRDLTYGLPPVTVVPQNFWINRKPETVALAGFVDPDCQKVREIVGQTKFFLQHLCPGVPHLDFLCESDRLVDCQGILKSIYFCLQDRYGLGYRLEKDFIPPDAQAILRPHEVGVYPEGTCIDLTCLFVSCLENVKRHPLIIIVDVGDFTQHAFIGLWRKRPDSAPLRIDQSELRSLVRSKEIVVLDSMGFSKTEELTHGRQRFPGSQTTAKNSVLREPLVVALDITSARENGIEPMPIGCSQPLWERFRATLSRADRKLRRVVRTCGLRTS